MSSNDTERLHPKHSLWDLQSGETGIVERLECLGSLRRRLLDVGFVTGARVQCVGKSPHGDPKAFLVRGAVIALRSEDGKKILLE